MTAPQHSPMDESAAEAAARSRDMRRAIEAILLVSDEVAESTQLAQLVDSTRVEVDAVCAELAEEYEREERGFVLLQVAGGWRFQTHPDMAPWVERYVLEGQVSRLSAAALETLAIVAYKQPISRNQIAAIRGVNADGVMRTLEARGYVAEFARDPGPGRALLYATTPLFLERLGLNSLEELPALGDFVPGTDVVEALEATLMVDEPAIDHGVSEDVTPDLATSDEAAPPGNQSANEEE